MCGFIFRFSKEKKIKKENFNNVLNSISWRGPDAKKTIGFNNDKVLLGHCRLKILDLSSWANQPMLSSSGRYAILFNGEIYNHLKIRNTLQLKCKTSSDTETILEAYSLIGNNIFSMLDGMFAIIIYDVEKNSWVAARDAFGIKPLFINQSIDEVYIASEAAAIAKLIQAKPSNESIEEWKIIRRPVPGKSYFENIDEFLPGTIINSEGDFYKHWEWKPSNEIFSQSKFENLLIESIKDHEISDVTNVSLLSGGLDSAIISALSNVQRCYSVGLKNNNEFKEAQETADYINKDLKNIELSYSELENIWRYLTKLRGEPLSLPNEGLIYKVCSEMEDKEKVFLTGEGADEIFFGYYKIFRWALKQKEINTLDFLLRYGYAESVESERLLNYVNKLKKGKSPIEFVEDFFYQVHLTGLLRRMDFASMAASKEARVPFITKSIIGYSYRQPFHIKINDNNSKLPIRHLAKSLNLHGALNRKKIGFSTQHTNKLNQKQYYNKFQSIVLEELRW